MKRWLVNISVLLVSTAITLVALESVLRARAYLKDRAAYEKRQAVENTLNRAGYVKEATSFGFMVQLSKNDRIIFELKPNLTIRHRDVMVKTNNRGFRDIRYPWEKDRNTVRIFGIGDSVMFGQGVSQGREYLSVLEQALNARYPRKKWEVINSGVPEYNTVMEVETLKEKGMKYKPDVVILGFCSNDLELPLMARFLGLPDKIYFRERYLALDRSFLRQFVAQKLDYVKNDFPLLPNKYLGLSGGKAAGDALLELKRLSGLRGFDVVVVFLRHKGDRVSDAARRTCRELGFHVVDLAPILERYMKEHGIRNYFDSELTVSDGHPSALTHEMAAETILDYMAVSGLLDKHSQVGTSLSN